MRQIWRYRGAPAKLQATLCSIHCRKHPHSAFRTTPQQDRSAKCKVLSRTTVSRNRTVSAPRQWWALRKMHLELCLDPCTPITAARSLRPAKDCRSSTPALSTGPGVRSRARKCTHCASAIFFFFFTLAVDEPFGWDHRRGYRVYRDHLTQSHFVSIKP